jgi:hypothetical protein
MQPKVFDWAEFMQLSTINQRFGIRITKNPAKNRVAHPQSYLHKSASDWRKIIFATYCKTSA